MATTPRLDLRRGVTEPVVLVISRRQVETGDMASVLAGLKPDEAMDNGQQAFTAVPRRYTSLSCPENVLIPRQWRCYPP